MKIINKITGTLLMLALVYSCETDKVFYEGTAVPHFPTASADLAAERDTDTYQLEVGTTSSSSITVDLEIDPSSTAVEGVDFSISSKSVTIESGKFVGTTTITPIVENMEPGTPLTVVFNIVGGKIEEGKSVGLSQIFTLTIIRICKPAPGDYLVKMHDSYGDGWQTDDGNGGSGLQVTLDDGTVIEVGMCNPYQASNFDCVTGDYFSAEDVVTIPDGTASADWYFPGDYYGEISFEVYSPTDVLLYESGDPGALGAGTITIVNCN